MFCPIFCQINPPEPSSSTEGSIEPGSQQAQTEKVGNGVLIGAVVGGASFFAAVVVIIILIFRKWRKSSGYVDLSHLHVSFNCHKCKEKA